MSNLSAFRDMLAWSELGPGLLATSDDGYNVCVGSTPAKPILFSSYATHPRIRSDALNSDAAGRYQFLGRYWLFYKSQLKLPDFGPASQDKWCDQLLRECKALDDIDAGRIAAAIGKCSRWESLPYVGRTSNQPVRALSDLIAAYRRAGGAVA